MIVSRAAVDASRGSHFQRQYSFLGKAAGSCVARDLYDGGWQRLELPARCSAAMSLELIDLLFWNWEMELLSEMLCSKSKRRGGNNNRVASYRGFGADLSVLME
jgi:hypothetical protein